jgi:hypothetical protein
MYQQARISAHGSCGVTTLLSSPIIGYVLNRGKRIICRRNKNALRPEGTQELPFYSIQTGVYR